MGKALSPSQSWSLLLLVAASFAVLVMADELVFGVLLVFAVVMGLVIRLLWQAATESPMNPDEVGMEDEAVRCCICNKEYDPETPYARLSLNIEKLDGMAITVLDDAEVGACCRPSCLRGLWERLTGALPEGCAKNAERSMDAFSRLKR